LCTRSNRLVFTGVGISASSLDNSSEGFIINPSLDFNMEFCCSCCEELDGDVESNRTEDLDPVRDTCGGESVLDGGRRILTITFTWSYNVAVMLAINCVGNFEFRI
jgi:hypothetical protein